MVLESIHRDYFTREPVSLLGMSQSVCKGALPLGYMVVEPDLHSFDQLLWLLLVQGVTPQD
jgi:hypothetical protein